VVHVICGARNAGIIQPALVNDFEEVVNAREYVVHEDYSIEILILGTSQFVEGYECSIANFSEILDAVVKCPTCTLRCADGDAKADRTGEGIEDAKKSFCLVGGAILVDGNIHVMITDDGRDTEEGGKEVWNNVERIVEVDGKEIFVLSTRKAASVIVVGCLFLARARDRVEAAETEIKEPGFGRRWVVTNEGGVSVARLLHVERIEVSCTFASVMWREGAEEVEDTSSLLEIWRGGCLTRRGWAGVVYRRVSAAAPRGGGDPVEGRRDEPSEECTEENTDEEDEGRGYTTGSPRWLHGSPRQSDWLGRAPAARG
jgi:hypothetical protein